MEDNNKLHQNYRGLHFKEEYSQNEFEFGAHFSYFELYKRLKIIEMQQKESSRGEIKKNSSVRFNFCNFFNKESRNYKNSNNSNRTCAVDFYNKKSEDKVTTISKKERNRSLNLKNNINMIKKGKLSQTIQKYINVYNRNDNSQSISPFRKENTIKKTYKGKGGGSTDFSSIFSLRVNSKSRNRSFSNNNQGGKQKVEKNNHNSVNPSRNSVNIKKTTKCLSQSKNTKNATSKTKNNKKSTNISNNSLFVNIINPSREKKLKILFLQNNQSIKKHNNFSSSISQEKKQKAELVNKTIFFKENIKEGCKAKNQIKKSSYKITNLNHSNISSYFNTNNNTSNTHKNNNNSTLSSSNVNNNTQSTIIKKQ